MLPIDARVRPTAEQMDRAKVADELFRLHNAVNVHIAKAATQIMEGADTDETVKVMLARIVRAAGDTAERIKR